jgi:hypothetical protein
MSLLSESKCVYYEVVRQADDSLVLRNLSTHEDRELKVGHIIMIEESELHYVNVEE